MARSVSVRVDEKKRRGPFGSAAPVHSIETATVSRCSSRHAANPRVPDKEGKQEAKEDDDEREMKQHVRSGVFRIGWAAGCGSVREANGRMPGLSRGRPPEHTR
jgi:hypothetical protein